MKKLIEIDTEKQVLMSKEDESLLWQLAYICSCKTCYCKNNKELMAYQEETCLTCQAKEYIGE